MLVQEALRSELAVKEVFVARDAPAEQVAAAAEDRGVPVHLASRDVLEVLADTVTPQGVVAVVEAPRWSLRQLPGDASLVLLLASIRDPGNAGTLLRAAVAAGADAVIFCKGTVDPLHPKTTRAAAGSLFRARVVRDVEVEEAAGELRRRGILLLGAKAGAATPVDGVDLTRPVAIVLGNEAWGLPRSSQHLLDGSVSIPMPGPVESLNVGIAGSVLLFEAVRQRRLSSASTAHRRKTGHG